MVNNCHDEGRKTSQEALWSQISLRTACSRRYGGGGGGEGKKEKKGVGKKRKGDWREKEGNACYKNPVLFTSADAGVRKL